MSGSRNRRTYWIAETVTPLLRDRALRLGQKGFDVQFFTSLDGLLSELVQRRASVLIVSDDGEEAITEKILLTLMSLPEIQGAKMVMVRETHSERINLLAACANFRDIIPSNIDERLWLTRFLYATAGRPLSYVQPAGQITLNNISAVCLPARLTWVSDSRIRLECRARPPVGATLNLAGAFAAAAGVATISLTVRETHRTNLRYRFSDAIVADWSVPAAARERALLALAEIRAADPGPRCRVFVAVQSGELRSALLARLDDPRFDVATALQKQSIIDEPRFFTPDIVFVEAELLGTAARLDEMLNNLSEHATVVVLGGRLNAPEVLARHAGRRILELSRLPNNLTQSILNRYLPLRAQRASEQALGGANVLADHAYSRAEVTFPARLHRIHPLAAQIAMPFAVGNFALARLDSPLLRKMIGRHPYVKLTATYQDMHPDAPPFVHLADCYLADLDQAERKTVVTGLARLVTETLTRLDPGSFGAQAAGDTRTPELGSIRAAPAAALALVPPPAAAVDGRLSDTGSIRTPPPAAAEPPPLAPATVLPRRTAALDGVGRMGAAGAAAMLGEADPGPAAALAEDRLARALGGAMAPAHERLLPEIEEIAELLRSKTRAAGAEPAPARPRSVPGGVVRQAVVVAASAARAEELAAGGQAAEPSVRPRRIRRRKPVSKPLTVQQTLTGVAVVAFAAAVLWALFFGLAGHVEKSGGVYSDQLKKFAPHLVDPEPPKEGSESGR